MELAKLNLGQKIRQLRENRGKTLAEFAGEIGFSARILKELETGEISPPIATLLNIARHCGVELGYFFDAGKSDRAFTVVKRGSAVEAKRILPRGKNPLSYTYKTLAVGKAVKHMEPFLVEFSVKKEEIPRVAHDGEEFVYILRGKLEFCLGNEKMIIEKGDSLYFESRYPHSFKAVGKTKARAVVVLYPH